MIEELVREVSAVWHTEEMRKIPPTALDGSSPYQQICSIAVFLRGFRWALHL